MKFPLAPLKLLPNGSNSPLESFLARLQGVRRSGAGYMACCPAHDDRTPSLSIREGQSGRVLFTCHAGCEARAILGSLGLTWQDLQGEFSSSPIASPSASERVYTTAEIQSWPWTKAAYEYCEEDGTPLFLVVRFEGTDQKKRFGQYRAQSPGAWLKGLDGTRPVLYRLPEVLQARSSGRWIFIVEGEKDAETLRALGLVATCNPGGAGKWLQSFSDSLRGARVALLGDNDEVGQNHVQRVALELSQVATDLRLVTLPGLPLKGDVTDWVEAGGGRRELERLVETTTSWKPKLTVAEVRAEGPLHLTDLGNGQRLVERHRETVRYCYPWQRWLIWDGKRWAVDETGELPRRAKETVRSIYAEAAGLSDDRLRQATSEHARRSEAVVRLKAMITVAESEPGIPIVPAQLDAHPWLLNCLNGTLDLQTGRLRAHQPADLLTRLVPVPYDPEARCPTWEAFLHRTVQGNVRYLRFLQRVAGYALTNETREHCLFFLYGTGRNGKSTFLECLYGMLGDYSQKADFSTFLEKKHDSIRNDLARLKGCRFLAASETAEGRRLAESLVKDLTGGETITARHLYGEYFDFKPSFKLFLSANHKPAIRGTDEGIWSRIRLLPFNVYLSPEERDPRLAEKLREEWPGILAWAVQGCLDWQRLGLDAPREVEAATREYREEMDPLTNFLASQCELEGGASATARGLFEAYCGWCQQTGEEPISQKAFGTRLADRGLERFRLRLEGQVTWQWRGIRLL